MDAMLSEKARGFIFDVDGTLVESNPAHALAWSRAFAESGIFDAPPWRIRTLVGLAGSDLVQSLKPKLGKDEREEVMAAHRRIFANEYLTRLRPTRGARELLEELHRHRKKIVAVSSASKTELAAVLDVAKLGDVLPVRICADDVTRSKPWPDPLLFALECLSLGRDEALSIGDSPYDVAAAHEAEVFVVALRCGGWSVNDLAGADGIFDDPADLQGALFESVGSRHTMKAEANISNVRAVR